ncbi:hypothetical protein CYLTODRAFT_488087 [Cylindrobasidium torrendii FP15055 ss-10]|uniref:Uncharacterized protein n=1 Tax=Cylindrobasidium torrendii FP15055 ss-10 TaxID=1314674 RepID=A0A0D7BIX8_9AGAR|nr:hypothetical protein CYLTODRAFT_488087 [Cylindrobasidium torrendii FP15055 ss-10]
MTRFGDFRPLCTNTPSYTWCNIFYKHLVDIDSSVLSPSTSDPVGINPKCGIPRVGYEGSISNIANIIACGISIPFVVGLIYIVSRRKAAVGRVELRALFIIYLLTLPFQLLTTGSLLEQGSTALIVLTAIHAGLVVALFSALLANAVVATQVVEDGTMASIVPFSVFTVISFVAGLYVSLDIGLGFTDTLAPGNPQEDLHSIALFILTSVWPAACAVLFLILMIYIVLGVLKEVRPVWFYVVSAAVFVLGQLAWFLLGKVICRGSDQKVDGRFIGTVLETATVGLLYLAWKSITEESWDEDPYYGYS